MNSSTSSINSINYKENIKLPIDDHISSKKMPYLYIDVNINDSEVYTINVCEGDEPEDLAKQFSTQHGFDNQAELL